MVEHFYVFWLMPQKSDKESLQAIMDSLSKEYGTVRFEPHVTLAPPVLTMDKNALESLTKQAEPITLSDWTPSRGNMYTQSVFLKAQGNAALFDLYHNSRTLAGLDQSGPEEGSNFPHLSLMYSNDDDETRQAILETLDIDLDSITFDAIQLMRIELPVTSAEDVLKWKAVDIQKFH